MASNASDSTGPRVGGLPRIGLPTYVEPAQWGAWDRPAALLPRSYVDAVTAAGGLAVMLPPVDVPGAAEAAVDALDGLVLTGGADIGDRADRDGWEHALLTFALERDLPVLAVCRGLQLVDVAMGGTLHQHVPDVVGHEGHRPVPGTYGSTHVKVTPGTRLASIIGDDADVPCHHHQSIAVVAAGLEVAALADDGVIEAIEAPDRRFLVGVQWHPEDGSDARLFAALVEAARA